MRICRILCVVVALVSFTGASAQITTISKSEEVFNVDSIVSDFDSRPFFGLYKDNYFVAGTALNEKPSQFNSDVKFQVSFSQRLTRSVLPWHSHIFLFYTQKAMWNVFEESLPFHDLNFNPGIGISKLLIARDKLVGKATVLLEHESNGRDGEASRSWNKLSFSAGIYIDPHIMVHAKLWFAIIDGKNNRDILKYCGIYQAGIQGISPNERWVFDATYVKRQGWNLKGNVTVNIGFRLRPKDNQFLMLHYYNGYGENLLDYNKYHHRLRIGLLIRPRFFSDF